MKCTWMKCWTASFLAPMFLAGIGLSLSTATARAVVIDFEDLTLAPDSVWKGVDPIPNDGVGVYDSFTSGGAVFDNYRKEDLWDSWSGWAYSNKTYDPSDYMPGDNNPGDGSNGNPNPVPVGWPAGEFHAVAGTDAGGPPNSANYGVAYPGFNPNTFALVPPEIVLPQDGKLEGAYFTNVNYAYYAMLEGDPPVNSFHSKQFTTDDEDWFLVTVTGKDAVGGVLGSVPVYLADLRDPGNRSDNQLGNLAPYILDDWTYFDLSSLSEAATLEFGFMSSDNHVDFGMMTPSYLAIDNIVIVPEPSTIALIGIAACCSLAWWRRGRKK